MNQQNNKPKYLLIIVLSIIFVLILCCCTSFGLGYYYIDQSTRDDAKQVSMTICSDNLEKAYETRTTDRFKEKFTIEDFESYIELVQDRCSQLEEMNITNYIQDDLSLDITDSNWDKVEYFVRTDEGRVYFLFVYEADDSLTLDNISNKSIDN